MNYQTRLRVNALEQVMLGDDDLPEGLAKTFYQVGMNKIAPQVADALDAEMAVYTGPGEVTKGYLASQITNFYAQNRDKVLDVVHKAFHPAIA